MFDKQRDLMLLLYVSVFDFVWYKLSN